jgi:hypothetical protein
MLTTEQVRERLGLGPRASVHRAMARRIVQLPDGTTRTGIKPVARQPGRDGQDLWPAVDLDASTAPGKGARTDRKEKTMIPDRFDTSTTAWTKPTKGDSNGYGSTRCDVAIDRETGTVTLNGSERGEVMRGRNREWYYVSPSRVGHAYPLDATDAVAGTGSRTPIAAALCGLNLQRR